MVVTAALVTVFLWGERVLKHNNFYPKQEIGTWTPVLTYYLSRIGSVIGAWSSPHQCPSLIHKPLDHATSTNILHCQSTNDNLEHVGTE